MFEHGTVALSDGGDFEITNALAEYILCDDMSQDTIITWLDVVRTCFDPAHTGAFVRLYYGTFDPTAQCAIGDMTHITCGTVDVYAKDANPYAVVELDRLFPHIIAEFTISEIQKT